MPLQVKPLHLLAFKNSVLVFLARNVLKDISGKEHQDAVLWYPGELRSLGVAM